MGGRGEREGRVKEEREKSRRKRSAEAEEGK